MAAAHWNSSEMPILEGLQLSIVQLERERERDQQRHDAIAKALKTQKQQAASFLAQPGFRRKKPDGNFVDVDDYHYDRRLAMWIDKSKEERQNMKIAQGDLTLSISEAKRLIDILSSPNGAMTMMRDKEQQVIDEMSSRLRTACGELHTKLFDFEKDGLNVAGLDLESLFEKLDDFRGRWAGISSEVEWRMKDFDDFFQDYKALVGGLEAKVRLSQEDLRDRLSSFALEVSRTADSAKLEISQCRSAAVDAIALHARTVMPPSAHTLLPSTKVPDIPILGLVQKPPAKDTTAEDVKSLKAEHEKLLTRQTALEKVVRNHILACETFDHDHDHGDHGDNENCTDESDRDDFSYAPSTWEGEDGLERVLDRCENFPSEWIPLKAGWGKDERVQHSKEQDARNRFEQSWPEEWPVYWEGGDPTGLGRDAREGEGVHCGCVHV